MNLIKSCITENEQSELGNSRASNFFDFQEPKFEMRARSTASGAAAGIAAGAATGAGTGAASGTGDGAGTGAASGTGDGAGTGAASCTGDGAGTGAASCTGANASRRFCQFRCCRFRARALNAFVRRGGPIR